MGKGRRGKNKRGSVKKKEQGRQSDRRGGKNTPGHPRKKKAYAIIPRKGRGGTRYQKERVRQERRKSQYMEKGGPFGGGVAFVSKREETMKKRFGGGKVSRRRKGAPV